MSPEDVWAVCVCIFWGVHGSKARFQGYLILFLDSFMLLPLIV